MWRDRVACSGCSTKPGGPCFTVLLPSSGRRRPCAHAFRPSLLRSASPLLRMEEVGFQFCLLPLMASIVPLSWDTSMSFMSVGLWVLNTTDTRIHCILDYCTVICGRGRKSFKWLLSGAQRSCSALLCLYLWLFLRLLSSARFFFTPTYTPWTTSCTPLDFTPLDSTPLDSTSLFSLMNPRFLFQVSECGLLRDLSCNPQRLAWAEMWIINIKEILYINSSQNCWQTE